MSVTSAGIRPRSRLHPNTVRVLREQFDIDVAGQRPRHLENLAGHRFARVITLCDKAREVCPDFANNPRRAHWSIHDPATCGRVRPGQLPRLPADRYRHRHPGAAPAAHPDFDQPLKEAPPVTAPVTYVSVRYIVDDVQAAIDFYTTHLGFTVNTSAAPAFADVVRGPLRLLLSGPASSGARATPDDAADAGRNRIHLVLDDLDAEVARLRDAGLSFRSEVVAGPGGRQVLLADPAGNLIELFQPAAQTVGAPATVKT